MAVTQSPRLGLNRWSSGADPLTRAQLDADHARIDANVAIDIQVATFNQRPPAGVRGRYCWVADMRHVYRDTGTEWVDIAVDQILMTTEAGASLIAPGWKAAGNTAPLEAWWRNGSCTIAGALVVDLTTPPSAAIGIPSGIPNPPAVAATYSPAQVVAGTTSTTLPNVRTYIASGQLHIERIAGGPWAKGMTVAYSTTYTYGFSG